MIEHWILVLEDPRKADRERFASGNFKSVGIHDAIERLRSALGEPISKDQARCFKNLQEHRNRVLHFFHTDYEQGVADSLEALAAEQAQGWYHLSKLLNDRWADHFAPYREKLNEIDAALRKQREFLKAKFDGVGEQLAKLKASGSSIFACPACGYESLAESSSNEVLAVHQCLVCDFREDVARLPCPRCAGMLYIRDLGEGRCYSCGHEVDLDWIRQRYHPDPVTKDDLFEPQPAYCTYCEHVPASAFLVAQDEPMYVCFNCLAEHETVEQCGYCSELNSGTAEDSYLNGCVICEGKLGNIRED